MGATSTNVSLSFLNTLNEAPKTLNIQDCRVYRTQIVHAAGL